VILNDLAKYSVTRSIARSICDSWASCFGYRYLGDGDTDRREILHDGTCLTDVSAPLLDEVPPGDPPNPKFTNPCMAGIVV